MKAHGNLPVRGSRAPREVDRGVGPRPSQGAAGSLELLAATTQGIGTQPAGATGSLARPCSGSGHACAHREPVGESGAMARIGDPYDVSVCRGMPTCSLKLRPVQLESVKAGGRTLHDGSAPLAESKSRNAGYRRGRSGSGASAPRKVENCKACLAQQKHHTDGWRQSRSADTTPLRRRARRGRCAQAWMQLS